MDISKEACDLTLVNAEKHGLTGRISVLQADVMRGTSVHYVLNFSKLVGNLLLDCLSLHTFNLLYFMEPDLSISYGIVSGSDTMPNIKIDTPQVL